MIKLNKKLFRENNVAVKKSNYPSKNLSFQTICSFAILLKSCWHTFAIHKVSQCLELRVFLGQLKRKCGDAFRNYAWFIAKEVFFFFFIWSVKTQSKTNISWTTNRKEFIWCRKKKNQTRCQFFSPVYLAKTFFSETDLAYWLICNIWVKTSGPDKPA